MFLLQFDKNGDSLISLSELKEALDVCGFKLPGWQVRKLIEEYDDKDKNHVGQLSLDEFEKVIFFPSWMKKLLHREGPWKRRVTSHVVMEGALKRESFSWLIQSLLTFLSCLP